MPNLPSLPDDPRRELDPVPAQGRTTQDRTELAIFEHHLQTRYVAECERIDAEALSDVVRASLEEEMAVLDWGMEQAAGSAVKAELVSRKVSMQTSINTARIARRYGGR